MAATLSEKSVICPKCLLPAPRVVKWQQANSPRAECPRCLYPQYREGGTWHHAMPPKDLHWYERRGLL